MARLSRGPPRGVHPANPPRAGRQQGYAGSDGCAGGPFPSQGRPAESRPGEEGVMAHAPSDPPPPAAAGISPVTGSAVPPAARPAARPAALALYRKYRPATFAEIKGQEQVTEPLRQALRSGRINHAYLFSGPRGCGKTSSARILARS